MSDLVFFGFVSLFMCCMQRAENEDYIEMIHELQAAQNEVQQVMFALYSHQLACRSASLQ